MTKPTATSREGPELVRAPLPEGWAQCTLGSVVLPSKDKVDPATVPRSQYLSLEHIESNTGRILNQGRGSDVRSTKTVFRAGDVLYGRLRPYLNKVCVPEFDGICSTEILVFPSSDLVDSRFLAFFLSSRDVVSFANHHSTGVQLPRIGFESLSRFPVALPPSAEQKRIVAKIGELLAHINAAQKRIEKLVELFRQFQQALSAAACSGKLTEDWRSGHPNAATFQLENLDVPSNGLPAADEHLSRCEFPDTWIRCRVDALVSVQNGRAFPSEEYRRTGVKLLRPGNLHIGGAVAWNDDNTVCLPPVWAKRYPSYLLGSGELVMNLTAQSLKDEFLGRVCLKKDKGAALLNQRIARLSLLNKGFDVRPYLFVYFRSPLFRGFVNGLDTGSLIQHMHSKDVARHVVPVPPAEEQTAIVARVGELFRAVDTIKRRLEAMPTALAIRTAILHKALSGRLVPTEAELARVDGRDYEPASALLKNIRHAQQRHTVARPTSRENNMAHRRTGDRRRGIRKSLDDVLREQAKTLTPNELFDLAGFDESSIDVFYEELRRLMQDGKILENRPNRKDSTLKALRQ